MLNSFKLLRPTTVAEASGELSRLGENSKLYAGGAELVLLMRNGMVQPDYLIDIKGIDDLGSVTWNGNSLKIGACATHHRLERDPLVRRYLPAFAYAESQVANVRVRAQGTLGGNLCFSDPHSDAGTALLIYEPKVNVASGKGSRQMTLEEFLVGMYVTALDPDELLVDVRVSPLPPEWTSAYLRVHRYQRPTLGVAAAAKIENDRIQEARLAAGCVSPKPERLRDLESALRGASIADSQRIIRDRRSYLKDLLEPVDDLLGSADYKLYMTQVLLGRALEEAAKKKDEGGGMKDERSEVKQEVRNPQAPAKNGKAVERFQLAVTVNGQAWQGEIPVEETLLDFLRTRRQLTGTKRSCESEVCGACTVLVGNLPVSACSYLAFEAHGKSVTTVEGLAVGEQLDPLQQGFIRNLGAQCGYCTPGQLMAAKALLLENSSPSREEIAEWLRGNICRCGAYAGIEASILEAAGKDR
ncbi:MAG: FAD binding domain-containing protein [Candidatus Binatia bacterium]